jgi:hypothetical protein
MRICNTLGVGEEIGLVVSILAVAKKGRPRGIAAALMRAGAGPARPKLGLGGPATARPIHPACTLCEQAIIDRPARSSWERSTPTSVLQQAADPGTIAPGFCRESFQAAHCQ